MKDPCKSSGVSQLGYKLYSRVCHWKIKLPSFLKLPMKRESLQYALSAFEFNVKSFSSCANKVDPLKTDTLRNRLKSPSQRGVCLGGVLEVIDIYLKEFNVQLIVVRQAPIYVKMVYQSNLKIIQSVAYQKDKNVDKQKLSQSYQKSSLILNVSVLSGNLQ